MTTWLLLLLLQCPAPSSPPAPCAREVHRQLDFWVGDWDVLRPDGKPAGRNTITRELGDCVVQEHWTGTGGLRGSSFNVWQPATGAWHQTWVDSAGSLLLLTGRLDGKVMVFEGEAPASGGGRAHHSIRLEPLEGGRVRQVWRSSADGGATWNVVFDGLYVPRASPATN